VVTYEEKRASGLPIPHHRQTAQPECILPLAEGLLYRITATIERKSNTFSIQFVYFLSYYGTHYSRQAEKFKTSAENIP